MDLPSLSRIFISLVDNWVSIMPKRIEAWRWKPLVTGFVELVAFTDSAE